MTDAAEYGPERDVAIAMFIASGDGSDTAAGFDALPQEDRDAMLTLARAATVAHVAWMQDSGFRIAPPGMMLRPKSEDDAKAMILAGREYLAKPKDRKALLARPALVIPRGVH
jgi:hypothetical protein